MSLRRDTGETAKESEGQESTGKETEGQQGERWLRSCRGEATLGQWLLTEDFRCRDLYGTTTSIPDGFDVWHGGGEKEEEHRGLS